MLQDPISATLREQAQATQQTALSNYQTSIKNAEGAYQKLAKLTPKDPNAQFQLAQAADAAGDTKVALAAYKAVVKLVPVKTDPLRTNAERAHQGADAGGQEVDSRASAASRTGGTR